MSLEVSTIISKLIYNQPIYETKQPIDLGGK